MYTATDEVHVRRTTRYANAILSDWNPVFNCPSFSIKTDSLPIKRWTKAGLSYGPLIRDRHDHWNLRFAYDELEYKFWPFVVYACEILVMHS